MDKNAEFKDRVVVITGAAGIFGRWIAEHFAREGAKLCLSDVRPDGRAGRDSADAAKGVVLR